MRQARWTTYAILWPLVSAIVYGAVIALSVERTPSSLTLGLLYSVPTGLVLGGNAIAAGSAAVHVLQHWGRNSGQTSRILFFALATAMLVTGVSYLPFAMAGIQDQASTPLTIIFVAATASAASYAPKALTESLGD